MGVHWKVGSAEGLLQAIPRRMDRFMAAAEDVVREVIEQGAIAHREAIDRIDTGLMRGSVGFEGPTVNGKVIRGEFGWTQNQEQYFLYQEYGTSHLVAMSALTDAGSQARERLVSMIADAIRQAWS